MLPTLPRCFLVELPNEVLSRIIKVARPSDLLSFSCSSKLIYALAKKALRRHLELSGKYSALFFGYANTPHEYATSKVRDDRNNPFLLLNSIIQDPAIAEYPTRLSLGCYYYDSNGGGEEENGEGDVDERNTNKVEYLMKKQATAIAALVQESGFIPEAERDWWTDAITRSLDRDAAIALLMTLLPNVEILDTENWSRLLTSQPFRGIIRSIVEASQDVKSSLRGKAMSRLREFRSCHTDTEGGEGIDDYGAFAMLPSVRVLSGSAIAGEGFTWAPSCIREVSNVTEINFFYSAIDASAIETLLSRIPGLRKFTYSHGGATVDFASYSPTGYVEALRKYATPTLEVLDVTAYHPTLMTDEEEENRYVGSLVVFSCLKSVQLDDVAFQRSEDIDDEDDDQVLPEGEFYREDSDVDSSTSERMDCLVDVLPASIENVTIRITMKYEAVRPMFQGLAEEKVAKLPRLTSITFEGDSQMKIEDPLENGTKAALKGAGIMLKSWGHTL
ncbi:MAG: hypothetical protein Q9222_000163 [Ikaeria aurantiellina]